MCPVPFYPTLCALSYLIEKVKRLTGKGLCVCVCSHKQMYIFVCVCMDPCTFIYVCIWMYVQLCMCLRNPYFDLFHSAWVLNYSCVCVCSLCAFLRVCVCVFFCGSNNQPPAPSLNTCSPINMQRAGAHSLLLHSHCFLSFFPFFPLFSLTLSPMFLSPVPCLVSVLLLNPLSFISTCFYCALTSLLPIA